MVSTAKKFLLILGVVFLTIALVIGGFIGFFIYSLNQATTTTTSVSAYSSKLSGWQATGLAGHFPSSIPTHATDVRFSEFPGFLQGGGHLQLHLIMPSSDVQALSQQMHAQAIHVYPGGGGFFTQVNDHDGVATAVYHTADTADTYDFPADFIFYVLYAHDAGGSWNHGESTGVAINPLTNQVVYWAENW